MAKVQNCAVRHAPTRGRLARCSLRRRSLYPATCTVSYGHAKARPFGAASVQGCISLRRC